MRYLCIKSPDNSPAKFTVGKIYETKEASMGVKEGYVLVLADDGLEWLYPKIGKHKGEFDTGLHFEEYEGGWAPGVGALKFGVKDSRYMAIFNGVEFEIEEYKEPPTDGVRYSGVLDGVRPQGLTIRGMAKLQWEWVERMDWHNKGALAALALVASEFGEAVAELPDYHPDKARFADLLPAFGRAVNAVRVETRGKGGARAHRGYSVG